MISKFLGGLRLLAVGFTLFLAGFAHAQIPSRIVVNPSFEIPNLPDVCSGSSQQYLPDSSYTGFNEGNKVPGWHYG